MTKPSQRRPPRYDQSGCMWGLISILDFRHGSRSTRKLLADKRHGSRLTFDAGDLGGKPESSTNVEGNLLGGLGDKMSAADAPANKPSVKKLIEEEMVSDRYTGNKMSNPSLHPKQHVDRKKNRKRSKNSRGSLDMDAGNLNSGRESFNSSKCPCNHTSDEGLVNKQSRNDTILEEFCNRINQRGISEICLELKPKNSHLEVKEKLHEAIKEFISREVANEKSLMENGRVNFSKEVVDALQIRNLNEESFLKLLQDPNFLSVKNKEILNSCKDDKLKDSEELLNNNNNNNSKQCKFFRRHEKFQETKTPKNKKVPDSNTIVILKPGPNALKSYATESRPDSLSDSSRSKEAERARAYFFLAEIKRRWKNVMGKEQNSDTVVKRQSFRFRGENPEKKSPSKDRFFIEKIAKPRDSKVSNESRTVGRSKQRVPNIYTEAKRHLSDMVGSGYEESDSSLGTKSPKSLARILAFSEFNSSIPSPGRNWERNFVTAQMRFSGHSNDQFEKGSENAEQTMVENNGSCLNSLTQRAEAEPSIMVTSHGEIEEEACSPAREDTASDGNIISTDEIAWEECSGMNAPSELISSPSAECVESIHSLEINDKDGETQMEEADVVHGNQSPSPFETPPRSCIKKTAEASEISEDKPERPSPVSVLEPLFMVEEISPARTTSRSVEQLIKPLEIKFENRDNFISLERGSLFKNCIGTEEEEEEEEDILLLYVRSVLRACGPNWNELYLKSQSSDELLEPSFYGEVDFFCNHPQYDQNLVFDCINEVLLEMIDQYFRFCTLVSFTHPIIRPISNLKDASCEVWKRVRWHLLLPMPLPRTLDQIVRKDMKSEKWMDLRAGTDSIGFEMGDEILDDLIEDCVDEKMQGLHSSTFAKIKENGANVSS